MSPYLDALEFLAAHETESNRTLLSASELQAIKTEYPGVPEDYLCYLRDVGWGSFRESQFMVYSGLDPLAAYVDERWLEKLGENIVVFGDNFSGDFGVFLLDENWAVADCWHDAIELHRHDGHFGSYIRSKMLIGPDGRDQRVP